MSRNKDLPDLLTIRQVADKLSVHVETLRRWDKQGKLKAMRVGSRRGVGDRRYKREDVEKYLKRNRR